MSRSTAHPRLQDLALARSALDRAAHRRAAPDLLAQLWADPATRVLPVRSDAAPVRDVGRAVGTGSTDGMGSTDATDGAQLELDDAPPAGDPPTDALWLFLGEDADGAGHLAVEVPPDPEPEPHTDRSEGGPRADGGAADGRRWQGLRDLGELVGDLDAGRLTTAAALTGWHRSHPRCPRCGTATLVASAGWTRRCPQDGSEHYPRTDAAVIMTVVDADDRLLLGHNPAWPTTRYSTLAGFVEPGEPLEDAVRREVLEEVGVRVGDVEYLGSQPWPFPASLMLGFRATATSTDVQVDGEEITGARWFTRAELADAVAGGQVQPPGGISIARRLVEHWFGGPLPVPAESS